MTMNRFTGQAQEALQRAQQIMYAKQHTQLEVEHIFLALLQQPNSLSAQIITHLGGDVPAIISKLEDALRNLPSQNAPSGIAATGYISLRANQVLQGAIEEAHHLNDEFISTEHLLLAITDRQDGPSARILQQSGIDRGKIFVTLRMVRREQPQAPEEPSAMPTMDPKIQSLPSNEVKGPKSKIIVNPPSLPQPKGFNHGILVTGGRILFLSGQTALDAEGHIVTPGDVLAQYRQVLNNLKAVVEEAGGTMQDIVKTNIFVRDRNDYVAHLKELGQVHKSFFGAYYPATALFEISRFFDEEALVEIEGIAVLDCD